MSIRSLPRHTRRGFSLLEVIIAVLIISMLMVSVFRFVKTVLTAVHHSTQAAVEKQKTEGLLNFLRYQLESLPPRQQGGLVGTTHKYGGLAADEIEWICTPGHGLLTTAATDEYRVTLTIQNSKDKAGGYEIGLRRRPLDSDERTYNWLPLLRPAVALEIRYFEPRSKTWIDQWKDPNTRPTLVRVRIWQEKDTPPVESIIALPAALSQRT